MSRNLQGPGGLETGSEALALGGLVATALSIWEALDAGLHHSSLKENPSSSQASR